MSSAEENEIVGRLFEEFKEAKHEEVLMRAKLMFHGEVCKKLGVLLMDNPLSSELFDIGKWSHELGDISSFLVDDWTRLKGALERRADRRRRLAALGLKYEE